MTLEMLVCETRYKLKRVKLWPEIIDNKSIWYIVYKDLIYIFLKSYTLSFIVRKYFLLFQSFRSIWASDSEF